MAGQPVQGFNAAAVEALANLTSVLANVVSVVAGLPSALAESFLGIDNLDPTWTAITFLMVGLILVFIEIMAPGFFIAVPGGALTFMGALGLVWPDLMFNSRWSWALWPLAAIGAIAVNVYAYKRWAPAGRAPLTLVQDSLPGREAIVTVTVEPGNLSGKVTIQGQEWSARSESGTIAPGTKVRVVRSEGVHVVVTTTL